MAHTQNTHWRKKVQAPKVKTDMHADPVSEWIWGNRGGEGNICLNLDFGEKQHLRIHRPLGLNIKLDKIGRFFDRVEQLRYTQTVLRDELLGGLLHASFKRPTLNLYSQLDEIAWAFFSLRPHFKNPTQPRLQHLHFYHIK